MMMIAIDEIKRVHPSSWGKAGVYGIGIILVYYSALLQMVRGWSREDYSHCYLIPFVVLYLLWEKRKVLNDLPSVPSWSGFILFGLGILFYWLGELGGEFFTLYISFWLIIVGLCWIHLGWQKVKVLAFPLAFIVAMFPFPNFIYMKITLNLQLISSKLGVKLLQLYGMSAFREGNVIDLGFTQLQVVEACSGLRYAISLAILSILVAYFYRDRLWKRIVLVLSSIPVSIGMNSLRIAITGVLYEVWGAKVAEAFFHGFSGWLVFIVAFVIMLGEIWILKRIDGRGKREEGSGKIEEGSGKREEGRGGASFLRPPQFIVAMVILVLTFALSYGVEFREKTPIRKPLDQFPLEIKEWSGKRDTMEQRFIDELDFSDYVIVDYRDQNGKQINFYVAYYESQRKGESIHSPESCLPGTGWEFQQAGATVIQVGGNKSMKVNRAFMTKPGVKEIVYFWFPQRGRILNNAYELKIYAFWDALTRQRTDGALVRIITLVYPDEKMEDAESRLQAFFREITPVLENYLPN